MTDGGTEMTAVGHVLLVVDCQRDFCEGGSLPVEGGAEVAHAIADFIARHGEEYTAIIATRDWHVDPVDHFSAHPDYRNTWPVHCVAGTVGAEFAPGLDDRGPFVGLLTAQVSKGGTEAAYSGFEGLTDDGRSLRELLAAIGAQRIDIVGLTTDYCVRFTALDSVADGYDTSVLLPLTAAVAAETKADAVTAMEKAGVRVLQTL